MKKLKERKWWWAWQYEMIESWLEEKALNGYMVSKVTGFGEVFHFIKAEPKKVRFCVDYQAKLTPEYLQLLKEDGWEYINVPGNWIICSKEYDDVRPELFNDYDTIIDRNNRLLSLTACTLLLSVSPFSLIINQLHLGALLAPTVIIFTLAVLFFVFNISSLLGTNKALKMKRDLQGK
jgi:hypothetical protein